MMISVIFNIASFMPSRKPITTAPFSGMVVRTKPNISEKTTTPSTSPFVSDLKMLSGTIAVISSLIPGGPPEKFSGSALSPISAPAPG